MKACRPIQKSVLYCLVVVFSTVAPQCVPAQKGTAKLPEFEVATIKPIDMSRGVMHMHGTNVSPSGRVEFSTFSLNALICAAFNIEYWQLANYEEWMNKVWYDVEAVPPQTEPPTTYSWRHSNQGIDDPQLRKMLQALLIERFGLKYHISIVPGTVYLLEKSGKPIPLVASMEKYGEGFSGGVGFIGNRWGLYNTSMPQLASFASRFMEKQIVDRTDLNGAFDFRWTVADADPNARGDGFGDTYNQTFPLFLDVMGLKLTKSTGDIRTFVIDHAEPPSAN